MKDLRSIGKALKGIMTCPDCGGSKMIAVNGHKGHGVGLEGSSYYSPTGHEETKPSKHCCCPGGPMWTELASSKLGKEFRLDEAIKRYPNLSGQVPFWNPNNQQFCSVTCELWRKMIIEVYT